MLVAKMLGAKLSRTPVDRKISALQEQGFNVKDKAAQFSMNINQTLMSLTSFIQHLWG